MEGNHVRDFYAEIYAADLDDQAKWLEYAAKEKAGSIDLLTRHAGIKSITLLELGCGTGAVIKECARRNLASRYVAVDYVQEALERLHREAPGIECMTADITEACFHLDEPFDVVILSHVLSFKLLLDKAGFAVTGERWFVPEMSAESIRFVCKKDGFGKVLTLYTLFTLCYLARLLRPA